MQQKKDVKVLLADAFKQLVLEKPIEKITIKEITDRAGVIRVTFYNHFQDKYELLEWIMREECVNPIRVLLWNNMTAEGMMFLFNSMLKNKEFYSHVARTKGQNSFESIVQNLVSETINDYFLSNHVGKSRKYSWLTPKWIADYYAQSLTFVLMGWIERGMTIPPEDMVDMYSFIASHSMMDLPQDI